MTPSLDKDGLLRVPLSPYEAELQRDSIALRFPKALEREFIKSHLTRVESRLRVWVVAVLVVALASALFHVLTGSANRVDLDTGVLLGALVPAALMLTVIAWSRRFRQSYLDVALPAGLVAAASVAVLAASAVAQGREEALAFLTTHTLGAFFLMGLLFFQAFMVAATGVIVYCVAGSLLGMAPERLAYTALLVASVTGVGAWIMYGVETTNRRFFLERGVLGELAERDGLTGLRNRRAFDDHLLRVWQQSLRDRSPIAVLLIDLDHFKAYNDLYGHQAGDVCLRHVASMVQRFARRPLDLAARYGGEELAIVLYQVSRDHALAVAEQLRATIESSRIEHRGSEPRGLVTVSIGISWMEATLDRLPQDAVQLADQALYDAKEGGRNRVNVSGPDAQIEFSSTLRRVER